MTIDAVFKKEWFKPSTFPGDYIPADANVFVTVDYGSPDGDYTVTMKGFYDLKTGEIIIQECVPNDIRKD